MIFTKLKSELKLLLHEFDNYVDTHTATALNITNELRKALSSPVADIIAALMPANIDSSLRQQILSALDKAAEALTIADNCKQYTDANDKLNCFIQQLRLRDPQLQDAVLQKLAGLLAGFLDGNRLKQSLYDLYTQAKYTVEQPATTNS